jgi:hypothetical protein
MDVISNPANNEGLAIEIGQNTSKIEMHFLPESSVAQKRTAIFGGENRMHEDFCE